MQLAVSEVGMSEGMVPPSGQTPLLQPDTAQAVTWGERAGVQLRPLLFS